MDVRAAWGGRERFEWRNRLLVLIPIGLIVLISVVDVLSPTDVHLGPLLVIAPALAPSFAGPRTVAAIGALAVVAQVVIAVFHGGLTTSNHLAQIGALIALSALIVVAAGSRDAGSQGPYDETFHAVTEQLKTELGEDREARPSPPPGRSGTAIADSIHMDVGVAAGYAERMGLVESCGDHVRFVHSIIQSYLGVEYLKGLIREAAAPTETGSDGTHGSRHDHANDPLSTALRNDPGRELLTALVLYSRSYDVPPPCPGGRGRGRGSRSQGHQAAPGGGEGHARGEGPRNRRGGRGIARPSRGPEHRQARALDMFGAALDIDRFAANPLVGEVVDPLVGQGWNEDSKPGYWAGFQGSEHQKLERYKKDLVSRLGGTAWFVAHIDGPEPSEERAKASKYLYKSLFGLGCQERSYPVRVATAQEIGCGGGIAFDALREEDLLRDKPIPSGPSDQVAAGGVQTRRSDCVADRQRAPAAFGARYLCHDWQERERQCRQRHRDAGKQERENLERLTRKETLKAWVLPSLVASCLPPKELGGQDIERQKPYGILRGWMDAVSGQDADLRCQVALAQGFKQAANRWTESGGKDAEPGLAREARELMSKCSFWYTKPNLLHALALWEIAKKEKGQGRKTPAPTAEIRRTAQADVAVRDEYPVRDEIAEWLSSADATGYPLLRAAAVLARRAVQTRKPDRFLWIDETGVAGAVGSESSARHGAWDGGRRIPRWSGWSTLDPAARQLLSDVLIMLALTDERGDNPADQLRRLKKADTQAGNRGNEAPLPRCITRERGNLHPRRAAVLATQPDSDDECVSGCPFGMCPYPPKGPDCRIEFSELFCVDQHSLYDTLQPASWWHLRLRRRGRWQRHVRVAQMRDFWDAMADRARDRPLDKDEAPVKTQERQAA